jgi:hypothetical protein
MQSWKWAFLGGIAVVSFGAGFGSSMTSRGPASASAAQPHFEKTFELSRFYKGNTHTHSQPRSFDADSPTKNVLRWYRDHDYQFVALTEHYKGGKPGEFAAEETGSFAVLSGEEVSFPTIQNKYVHVSALCTSKTAGYRQWNSVREALAAAIAHTVAQPGAVAQINHPNYIDTLKWEDILSTRQAGKPWASLLEIANQHPLVHNEAEPLRKRLSTEAIWDALLTSGAMVYGVASDDTHHLRSIRANLGTEPSVPGLGWVQVDAQDTPLKAEAICAALAQGRFYASTGVEYERIRVSATEMEVSIAVGKGMNASDYVTEFFGQDGKLLMPLVRGREADYALRGNELYVRARTCGPGLTLKYPNRVVTKKTTCAWVQPVRVALQGM